MSGAECGGELMIDPKVSAHYVGDCRELLDQLPDGCVQTCITSPPYWGLRDYGEPGQLGLEATPEVYVAAMVDVFERVRRVLRDDGTLWLNIGDCYASQPSGGTGAQSSTLAGSTTSQTEFRKSTSHRCVPPGLKPKDLCMIPARLALALQSAGWYLRQDIIWSKPNPMPESVTDRCTKAHEYLFLLSKSATYYYDADAIAEPCVWEGQHRNVIKLEQTAMPGAPPHVGLRKYKSGNKERKERKEHGGARNYSGNQAFGVPWEADPDLGTRNKRSVWTVATQPYDGAHFACFPPALIEPCILAGSRPGDLVLDPFHGSGTTGMVAEKHERRWIGFDLSAKYAGLVAERTAQPTLNLTGARE